MAPRQRIEVSPEAALLEEQVERINRFPDQNPNPVLRMTEEGVLLYANVASAPIVRALGVSVGDRLPEGVLGDLWRAAADPSAPAVEIVSDHRTYAVLCVPVSEFGFFNLYGTDVTAEKVVARFPDQNPNPVFRATEDGRLLYANAASAAVVRALGVSVGEPLSADTFERIRRLADGASAEAFEVRTDDARTFILTPVRIPEFGFINVYGTDITAARELEKAHRENERLLLNILPEPIARRLREGERVIADRFEDVTLLFADIVGFTQMSSGLSAAELVEILNRVFSAFDGLVGRYGLEKIKTIGDAYMVVGGLPEHIEDHTARVADMALELRNEIARISSGAGSEIRFRVGMNVGPVVAGVIGVTKFIYDVWGDTVNTASRMEAHGVPDRIHVTHAVYERLRDRYTFEWRGIIDVKGKGPMETYFLLGRTEPLPRPAGVRSAASSAGT